MYRTALRRMRLRGVKREALGRVSDGDQRVERGDGILFLAGLLSHVLLDVIHLCNVSGWR